MQAWECWSIPKFVNQVTTCECECVCKCFGLNALNIVICFVAFKLSNYQGTGKCWSFLLPTVNQTAGIYFQVLPNTQAWQKVIYRIACFLSCWKILSHEMMTNYLSTGLLSRPLPRVLCWVRSLGSIYDLFNILIRSKVVGVFPHIHPNIRIWSSLSLTITTYQSIDF